MKKAHFYTLLLLLTLYLPVEAQTSDHVQIVPQIGHAADVQRFAISKDRQLCITGTFDKTVKLWNIDKCKLIRTFRGQKGEILGVAISPDNKYIASTSADPSYTLKVWETETGKEILDRKRSGIDNYGLISISPGNKYIICSRPLYDIEILDFKTGIPIKRITAHTDEINTIQCSADGKYFLTAGNDGKLILWDLKTFSKKRSFGGIKERANYAGFSDDGTIVFCSDERNILLFNTENGKKITQFGYSKYHGDISPDNKYLVTHDIVWDIATGQELYTLKDNQLPRKSTLSGFGADGKKIIVMAGTVAGLFDTQTATLLKTTAVPGKSIKGGVHFTADMQKVYFGDSKGNIVLWDINDLKISAIIPVSKKNITDICPNKKNSETMIGSQDGYVYLYNTNPFKYKRRHIVSVDQFPHSVSLSPDETHFAVVTAKYDPYLYFKEIKIYKDLESGTRVNSHYIKDQANVLISSDNKTYFSTYSGHSYVRVVSIDGKYFDPSGTLSHGDVPLTLAHSNDGTLLLTGCKDKLVRLWNAKSYSLIKSFEGHSDYVLSVAFSSDSKLAVSGSADNAIFIWNVETGKPVRKLMGHNGPVGHVGFSPDNKWIVSSSSDASFRLWNVETGHWTSFTTSDDNSQWLVYNSDGYWDASPSGGDFVAMVKDNSVWNIDQFAVWNNRPDMIMKALGSKNLALMDHFYKQHQKRLRKLKIDEPTKKTEQIPETKLLSVVVDGKSAKVKFSLSDTKATVVRYNIFVNDVPLYGALGKDVSGQNITTEDNVELGNGQNKIEVSCMNSIGVESYRELAYATCTVSPPKDLYLLAFGVSKYKNSSLNLQYAHKDALDLEKVMQTYKGKGFENVYTKVLTNEQVTPEAIKASKDFVKNAKPDDTFILFIAGHGMHDSDPEATYYYLTSNADLKNLKNTAADFETIEDLLQGIPPRNKLFLMDACESGEIDEEEQGQMIATATGAGIASRGFKKEEVASSMSQVASNKRAYLYQKDRYIYNDLVRRSGAIVFSSSKGGELSYERSDIENGFFTEYIMKALTTTEADKDKNGTVSTDELRQYVSEQVAKASGDLQHPTVDRDNIYQKFGFQVK